jgi:hypothetical protein
VELILVLLETFKFYLSNKAATLRSLSLDATVEAEYGEECVEGRLATLAHHGPRSSNPPPCDNHNVPILSEGSSVGLSHLDLDSLGGLLRLAGYVADKATAPFEWGFWKLAGMVDVSGPHRLNQLIKELVQSENLPGNYGTGWSEMLHAYWAWSQENRLFPPRDGSALDVTGRVLESAKVLFRILDGDEGLLEAGRKFAQAERELNESSLIRYHNTESGHLVIVRRASAFTNHLYTAPWGTVASVVISYRDDFKNITVSKENDEVPVNCRDLVQSVWGPEAGGHDGIAGSPRGKEMNPAEDLKDISSEVIRRLGGPVRLCNCGSEEPWAYCSQGSPYCG